MNNRKDRRRPYPDGSIRGSLQQTVHETEDQVQSQRTAAAIEHWRSQLREIQKQSAFDDRIEIARGRADSGNEPTQAWIIRVVGHEHVGPLLDFLWDIQSLHSTGPALS